MADYRQRFQLRKCFELPAPSASPLSRAAFSLAFVLFLLVLSALPASAPSPSGSSITAAAAAATTAAVAGADAAAMSARSVAIGALNGRGYPRVLAASPDSKLVGIHTSPEKRSIFKSSSGNPVNSASKSPSNAPNFFKPRNVEDNFAENPPPDPPLPTATSTARSRETISLLYTELLKRARPSPPLPPLAVPRPGSTEKSPKLGSRLISVMIRASPPPKKKTPSPPKKTANHSPKVPTKSPASASNTSPSKRGVSPPKRGTSPPKKRSPFLPKKRPPPPHSSSPPKQKSPKQPPPAKRSPPKRSPPKASPPKSPPPASPPKRRKPSSAQKSPPPPPPSPPTGSGGVDLGNAQKVLKMLQPYFDDPQFMMFAINGGLLTLMSEALKSTEKVTFFVPADPRHHQGPARLVLSLLLPHPGPSHTLIHSPSRPPHPPRQGTQFHGKSLLTLMGKALNSMEKVTFFVPDPDTIKDLPDDSPLMKDPPDSSPLQVPPPTHPFLPPSPSGPGLLTLMGKPLNSTDKVTFFVPDPDTIKDLPDDSPLINDPAIPSSPILPPLIPQVSSPSWERHSTQTEKVTFFVPDPDTIRTRPPLPHSLPAAPCHPHTPPGLLTLMGKALNSTEKVTFFVPDPDTIKDLPDDSPLINDPAIATAVVNLHVVRGRQVTYTELTQDATGTMGGLTFSYSHALMLALPLSPPRLYPLSLPLSFSFPPVHDRPARAPSELSLQRGAAANQRALAPFLLIAHPHIIHRSLSLFPLQYMTDQHEPLVKDAASFLFNVVLRPSQGPSRATITMPNAYTDESMQVHVLDSLLIPDSVYFAPPSTPLPNPPSPSSSASPLPPTPPPTPPTTTQPQPPVAAEKQNPTVATAATPPPSGSDLNTKVPPPSR
ncbi:unnamed protein product [Closterium sp. NIES-54]